MLIGRFSHRIDEFMDIRFSFQWSLKNFILRCIFHRSDGKLSLLSDSTEPWETCKAGSPIRFSNGEERVKKFQKIHFDIIALYNFLVLVKCKVIANGLSNRMICKKSLTLKCINYLQKYKELKKWYPIFWNCRMCCGLNWMLFLRK